MKFSMPALFGQRHRADRSLSTFQDTYDEQTIVPASEDDDAFIDTFSTKTPLRSLIKTEFGKMRGHTAVEQRFKQDATPDQNNRSRCQYLVSKIVEKYSKARETIVESGVQFLFKDNEPGAPVMCTDKYNTAIHPVHYRDIDLGYRREVIYTDVVTYLGGDDQGSEFDFGLSTWEELFSGQDDHFYNEAYSGAINWEHIQHTSALPIRDRSSIASLYEPLPPLSIISENALEDSSRPTTSSTNRKDSGEFLRRLQTGSSVGTRLHSRNISDASEITLPLSEDYYDPREAPAGENPSMLARTTECEAGQGHSIYSDEAEIAASQFAQGRMEADDDFVDYDDGPEEIMRLQAPPYVNFEWYEVNDLHESIPFDEEEHMETSRRNEMDTIHIDHESQKGHSLHVEQPIDDDNRSFISNYPDDHDVSTKTYGVFDAAFAQQVKDYSKLLDDLADPHATAQALGLVSSRLSLYLNSNSSADITSGRCVETEAAEKRQQMALPDLSDLGAFLDDDDNDDDADSGFHVSSTKFFACPAKPRPTPFADLKQFVDDDDLDLDMDSASRKKPVLNSFMGWTLSAGDEDENSEVLTDRTALRTRPPLRRTC